MNFAAQISNKDFSKKTIKSLSKMGIVIINKTFIPDASGNYLNGETAYELNDNGMSKMKTLLEVYKIAEGK